MPLISWEKKLLLKIESIDNQHKVLIGIINDLHDAMLKGKGKNVVDDILEKMSEYTNIHFRHEEDLFEKHGYPETESHKSEHKKFIEKISQLNRKKESGEMFLSVELMDFLKEWWTVHINKIDRQYSGFLKSKGVE